MSLLEPSELFREVVDASGVAPVLAPGTVRRALRDVGSTPQTASTKIYLQALPSIRARLRAFMSPEEAGVAIDRIRNVLASAGDEQSA